VTKPDSTLALTTPPDVEISVGDLFAECGWPLRRYVGSFGIGVPDTEDVVQDVFLSLFRHVQQGKSRHNLRGWLFTVAHNLALKHRARIARRRGLTGGDTLTAGEPLDPATNPEQHLAEVQRQARLRRVLRALPEQDRRCICLRAEGFRYREIAELTGLSLGAVAKSLARSMTRMGNADER
jgi:RNA polymerase sigma-70 factor (ECF subfamily)